MARGCSNELDHEELCDSRSSGGATRIGGEGERKSGSGLREVSIYEDKRPLAEPDFDDNLGHILTSLDFTNRKFLSIVDEENELRTIVVTIGHLP